MNRIIGLAIPLLLGFSLSAPELETKVASWDAGLPAPTQKRIVLHGVSFDDAELSVRPDSQPLMDEAAALTDSRPTTIVVDMTSDSRNEKPSVYCKAEIVRQQLLARGVAPQELAVTIDGAGPGNALAGDNAASCRVGLLP